MSKLKFKTFTWPENPEEFSVRCTREPVFAAQADKTMAFVGMGAWHRVFSGRGVFTGSNANSNFGALKALTLDSSMGTLEHPSWGSYFAYLTELEMTQPPKDNYVAYSFTFREATSSGAIPY